MVVEGTPEELKAALRGDALQVELVSEANGALVGGLPGVRDPSVQGRTVRARADDGARAVPAVLQALDARGVQVASVTVARPSLDDVYLRYAGRSFAQAEGVAA